MDDLQQANADAGKADAPSDAIGVEDANDAAQCSPLSADAEAVYELAELGSDSIEVDGSCSDAAWSRAALLPFNGLLESGNPPAWRMLWSAATGTLFACVEIEDSSYEAHVLANDQPMWATDDRLELWLDANPVDGSTIKVNFNRAGYYGDANFPNGSSSAHYAFIAVQHAAVREMAIDDGGTVDSGGAPDAGSAAVGWIVEWEIRPALQPTPGHIGRCEFAKFDYDGDSQTGDIAFGPLINGFATFGSCRYACPLETRERR